MGLSGGMNGSDVKFMLVETPCSSRANLNGHGVDNAG